MDRLAMIDTLRMGFLACVCAAMAWPVHAGKLTGDSAAAPSAHSGSSLERLAAAPGTLRIGEFDLVTGSGTGALPMTPRTDPAKPAPVRTAQEPRRSANTTAVMLPDAGCATLATSASSKLRSPRPEGGSGCW